MNIKSIDHITINVVDLDKSIMFYEKVLGLKNVKFTHMGDHTLTYMELPSGILLELIYYKFLTETVKANITSKGMFRHIAFVVDSISKMLLICNENNVKINMQPCFVEKLNCKAMLIQDPNGIEIEIVEKI